MVRQTAKIPNCLDHRTSLNFCFPSVNHISIIDLSLTLPVPYQHDNTPRNMDGFHPWNFLPLEYTELNLLDLDASTIEERLSTPRFDFESDVGNDHPSQDDVLEPIASAGPINSPPTKQPSAECMAPSRPMRKPKARTLHNEDWAPVKNRVVELLKEKPLGEVRSMIFTEFGFQAT